MSFFDQSVHYRILFNVISNELELLRSLYPRVVVTLLPRCSVNCQERVCLAPDVTHHVVHEFRQRPRLTQSE